VFRVRPCGCKYKRASADEIEPCEKHKGADKDSDEEEEKDKKVSPSFSLYLSHRSAPQPPCCLLFSFLSQARAMGVFEANKCTCDVDEDYCVFHDSETACLCFNCGGKAIEGECRCTSPITYEEAVKKGYIGRVRQLCLACPDKKPSFLHYDDLCDECSVRLAGNNNICNTCMKVCKDAKTHCAKRKVFLLLSLLMMLAPQDANKPCPACPDKHVINVPVEELCDACTARLDKDGKICHGCNKLCTIRNKCGACMTVSPLSLSLLAV
jgi:hypothetical protein